MSRSKLSRIGPDVSEVKLATFNASVLVTGTIFSPKLSSNPSALNDTYVLFSSVASSVLNLIRLRSTDEMLIVMKYPFSLMLVLPDVSVTKSSLSMAVFCTVSAVGTKLLALMTSSNVRCSWPASISKSKLIKLAFLMSATKLVVCKACVNGIPTNRLPAISSIAPVETASQVSAILVAIFLDNFRYLMSGCTSETVIIVELLDSVSTVPPPSARWLSGDIELLDVMVIKLATNVETLTGSLKVRTRMS